MGKFSKIIPSVGILAALLAGPAHAQDSGEADEIVVTGTSIRGVAPAGAAAVNLGQEAITSTSSSNTAELLTHIPQIGGFNTLQSVVAVGPQQTTNRPAVRGLTSGTSGGSPTLLLMNGRRLAGAGVVQTVPDPDVVPPGALARVEVAMDGGSAVYGSDAVGGVINLITRRDFDGFEFGGRQGFGDGYESTDADITAGHTWTGGSLFVSYDYSHHDAIFGGDRDHVRNITYDQTTNPALTGLGTGRACNGGTVDTGGSSYAINNGVPDTTAATPAEVRCDLTDPVAFYPDERRDSFFLGFRQELNSVLSFDLSAWYMRRESHIDLGPNFSQILNRSQVITAANNDYFVPITGAPGESQTVFYNYAAIPGLDSTDRVSLETYGFSPEFTMDLGHDWQARAFLNYGHSVTSTSTPGIDNALIAANASQINFYDLAASDPAVLQQLQVQTDLVGRGEDEIVNARAVFDGPLFTLPGGEVRAAVGIEYLGERFNNYNEQVTPPDARDTRRSHGVFGELNIPIVGSENNVPLIDSLNVNLSVRHDTYSDFGSVTNPRYGITYAPFEWLSFRGNWGTSFQAPSLADTAGAGSSVPTMFPTIALGAFLPFSNNVDATHAILAMFGATELDAQRAETYSIGFDVSPPFLENFDLGMTYYHIDYSGQVNSPPTPSMTFWQDDATFGDLRDTNGGASFSQAEVEAFVLAHGASLVDLQDAMTRGGYDFSDINVLVDNRRRNIGGHRLAGWDLYARYNHDTSFGSLYFSTDVTYQMTDKLNQSGGGWQANSANDDPPGLPGADRTVPRWGATTTAGATIGEDWRAQATVQYSPGYDLAPTTANGGQDSIDAVYPVNLYAQYDGLWEDLSLSLGVNNVFDQDPAHYNGINQLTYGYVGGNLGRVVYLGFNKKF